MCEGGEVGDWGGGCKGGGCRGRRVEGFENSREGADVVVEGVRCACVIVVMLGLMDYICRRPTDGPTDSSC